MGIIKVSGPLLTVGKMTFAYVQKKRQEMEKKEKEERQTNLLKRIFVVLITLLCAALLFAATAKALIDLKVLNMKNLVSVAGTELAKDSHGHTNILLLGKGDAGHDGIDLTDTIMVASIDPTTTKSVALLSIPRDLYLLKTENMGAGRINTMFRDYKITLIRSGKSKEEASTLAMKEVQQELGRALDMEIHQVIMVDFAGFVQAVDAIGGIDIEVERDLIDTEYPADENSYTTFQILAGPQHLDGETALKYARSRHSTSDFDRSRRQQQILKALGDKLKSGGMLAKPNRILELMSIMKDHVGTTLSVRDMLGLAKIGSAIDHANILSVQLNDQNGLYGSLILPGGLLYSPPRDQFGGASVLLPVSIPPMPITWKQINILVDLIIHTRAMFTDRTPIDIYNAGAKPGSGNKLNGELTRFAFKTDKVSNAPNKEKLEESVIRASEEHREKAAFLAKLLQMKLEILSPEASAEMDTSAISILLGKDYTFTPVQSLFPEIK